MSSIPEHLRLLQYSVVIDKCPDDFAALFPTRLKDETIRVGFGVRRVRLRQSVYHEGCCKCH